MLATLVFIYAEAMAIQNSNPIFTHVLWSFFIAWNIVAIWGVKNTTSLSKHMLKLSAYFQLVVIVCGYMALLTDIGYSIEINGQNLTHIGSFVVVTWAAIKLFMVKLSYENT
ncbi:hypothetical protein [Oceanicoccus sp. KOV_DT_Chl]|uniref:hypothetical protein n=1 Tax=Oceanicoccus sp. KOV_DT_Chl TaxID=1904639 RepID=UPI0011AFC360|nr:hypothetical protein [Oceanicoccus sp. KOV_DT_Chl]